MGRGAAILCWPVQVSRMSGATRASALRAGLDPRLRGECVLRTRPV